jgi:hypothetical protein
MDYRKAIHVRGQMTQGDLNPGHLHLARFPEGIPSHAPTSDDHNGHEEAPVVKSPGQGKSRGKTCLAEEKTRHVGSCSRKDKKKGNSHQARNQEGKQAVEGIEIMGSPDLAEGIKSGENENAEKNGPSPSGRGMDQPDEPIVKIKVADENERGNQKKSGSQKTNSSLRNILVISIHNDINLIAFVIPGLTPYPVRGRLRNPVFSWIPAFAGMTAFAGIKVAVYSFVLFSSFIGNLSARLQFNLLLSLPPVH